MSLKVICDLKNINTENLCEEITTEESGRKWILKDFDGEDLDLKFQIKDCRVKYTPEKYDKITVELPKSSVDYLKKFQGLIKSRIDIQDFIKGDTIGLKMSKNVKLLCMRALNQGDYIDIVVHFNDIWNVNGKIYVSLELIQFRKLTKSPKVDDTNYFSDDEE